MWRVIIDSRDTQLVLLFFIVELKEWPIVILLQNTRINVKQNT